MATVGRDFGLYADWMKKTGVPTDHVRVIDSEHSETANAALSNSPASKNGPSASAFLAVG